MLGRLPGPLTELLIVGLGNAPYPATRHSAGHFVVDSLAKRLRVHLSSQKTVMAGTVTIPIGGASTKIVLAKTKTLMNVSGRSVANALKAHLSDPVPSSLVVIQDSLNHKPFAVSHGFGGTAQGHNGIKDIISALGGQTGFHRLRVGIGRPDGAPDTVKDYVLGRLSGSERQFLDANGPGTDRLWQIIEKIVQEGVRMK